MMEQFYKHKRVLVTGHTGFKGSWLSIWLHEMGAEVVGLSLPPQTERDNYVLSGIGRRMVADLRGDIRNAEEVKAVFQEYQPEIVFHLAAQPLVRLSYQQPVETFNVNVMGTIHVMESMRECDATKVGVMVTTDKCYENREQLSGYREDDALGGYDPYSASKGAAEIAISAWRRSFMNPSICDRHGKSIASVRAGNVIGGGDWSKDRIVPDCIRALEQKRPIGIRSPHAVRPWQHVLEPLGGYLLLAQRMWEAPGEFAEAWNFGPQPEAVADVWTVATLLLKHYGEGKLEDASDPGAPHEANLLTLNIEKAIERLNWHPRMNLDQSLMLTANWYRRYAQEDVYRLCVEQISTYLKQ
ncbi:MAG: CDP-glucose 4,6-dehydratase [Bacteroidaceae bacterium]|nr:CDP-glucose 4,6-dehydratase [Bacteroidaceae bacterium]